MGHGAKVVLNTQLRAQLEATVRSKCSQVRDVLRANIILMSANGKDGKTIAAKLNTNKNTVTLWRKRFAENGLEGLKDSPGRGRKRVHGPQKVEEIVDVSGRLKP